MRNFELVLMFTIFTSLLLPLLFSSHTRWLSWLPILSVLVMLAQLFFEGYRWQMVPLYGLALLALLGAGIGWLRYPHREGRTRSGLQKAFRVLGIVLAGVAALLPALFPIPNLPVLSGAYPVGTVSFELVDRNRTELYSGKPDEPRRLMVQFWYPAQPANNATLAPWMANPDILAPAISRYLDLPPFMLDHIEYAHSHSYLDAPLNSGEQAFPVVLFSHGWNGVRMQSTFLMEELASHGYIVASLEHTYGAQVVVFPDGRVVRNNPDALPFDAAPEILESAADKLGNQWAGDLAFVLDTLAQWNQGDPNELFSGRLDLEQVGAMGHSTGGGVAIEFCGRDPRCKAAVGLDPYLAPISAGVLENGVSKPVLSMFSELYYGEVNNRLYKQLSFNSADMEEFLVLGSDHYDFSDLPLLSPLAPYIGLKGPINGPRMLGIVRVFTLAFFDKNLKGEAGVILPDLAKKYPEVIFDRLP